MAVDSTERVALMAIHPRFAEAILDGRKRVEFRKRRPAPDIRRVYIYATAPVSAVVGAFEIADVTVGEPRTIWEAFGAVGVIDRDDFDLYYASSGEAVAIGVESAIRFDEPVPLSSFEPAPATPQSFSYHNGAELAIA